MITLEVNVAIYCTVTSCSSLYLLSPAPEGSLSSPAPPVCPHCACGDYPACVVNSSVPPSCPSAPLPMFLPASYTKASYNAPHVCVRAYRGFVYMHMNRQGNYKSQPLCVHCVCGICMYPLLSVCGHCWCIICVLLHFCLLCMCSAGPYILFTGVVHPYYGSSIV